MDSFAQDFLSKNIEFALENPYYTGITIAYPIIPVGCLCFVLLHLEAYRFALENIAAFIFS